MIPSTPLDWQRSFYLYHKTWIAEHAPERLLAKQLADNTPNALCAAAHYFGVGGTLPGHPVAMDKISAIVRKRAQPDDICARRNAINELAYQAANIADAYGDKYQQPVSAMSKFLMLRFPEDSFVYDGNARKVLAALQNKQPPWLRKLDKFFQHWKNHAHPIIECLATGVCQGNPAGAARVVDKFLWSRGQKNLDKPIRGVPDNLPECAIAQGTAAWNALHRQGLTEPPQHAPD